LFVGPFAPLPQTTPPTPPPPPPGAARRGVAAGLLNLARHLGLIGGSALLGAVFAAGAPDPTHAAAADVATATHATFALAALLPLVGLGAAWLARRR
jgi:hypothetical protein